MRYLSVAVGALTAQGRRHLLRHGHQASHGKTVKTGPDGISVLPDSIWDPECRLIDATLKPGKGLMIDCRQEQCRTPWDEWNPFNDDFYYCWDQPCLHILKKCPNRDAACMVSNLPEGVRCPWRCQSRQTLEFIDCEQDDPDYVETSTSTTAGEDATTTEEDTTAPEPTTTMQSTSMSTDYTTTELETTTADVITSTEVTTQTESSTTQPLITTTEPATTTILPETTPEPTTTSEESTEEHTITEPITTSTTTTTEKDNSHTINPKVLPIVGSAAGLVGAVAGVGGYLLYGRSAQGTITNAQQVQLLEQQEVEY